MMSVNFFPDESRIKLQLFFEVYDGEKELVSLTSRSGNLGNWNLIVLPILSKIHHNVGSHARSASDSNGFV